MVPSGHFSFCGGVPVFYCNSWHNSAHYFLTFIIFCHILLTPPTWGYHFTENLLHFSVLLFHFMDNFLHFTASFCTNWLIISSLLSQLFAFYNPSNLPTFGQKLHFNSRLKWRKCILKLLWNRKVFSKTTYNRIWACSRKPSICILRNFSHNCVNASIRRFLVFCLNLEVRSTTTYNSKF